MANTVEEAVVHKSVRVRAPIERAFGVFVEQMETWWPATHHIGKTPFEAIFVERSSKILSGAGPLAIG